MAVGSVTVPVDKELPVEDISGIIVAEIFPDAELLADKGISDLQAYFEDQVRILSSEMPSSRRILRGR